MELDQLGYNDDFFDLIGRNTTSADRVVPVVHRFTQPGSVVDVGCGVGVWANAFKSKWDCRVLGIDGSHVPTDRRLLAPDEFQTRDLTAPLDIATTFDLAVCLEVAEHLPEGRADSFVRELTELAPTVLFSASVPHQGGVHHINERWPSYWASRFNALGYETHDVIRPFIWDDAEVEYYYRQNLLLFSRVPLVSPADVTVPPHPLDIVHPEMLVGVNHRAENPPAPTLREIVKVFPHAATQAVKFRLRRTPPEG